MPAPKSLLKGFEKTLSGEIKPHPTKRLTIFDESTTGLCLLVTPRGRKTFTLVARGPNVNGERGKQVWREVGSYPETSVAEARTKAREGLVRLKAGLDPFPPPEPETEPEKPETFNDVADEFIKRHVRKEPREGEPRREPALRSAPAIERQFRDFFRPKWGDRPFAEIGRSDVAKLLREIGDERGLVMADRSRATLSRMFKFQAEFMPNEWPIPTIGINPKTKASVRRGTRILADEGNENDLRLVWQAAESAGMFGAFVRILLLTGQRRAKVAAMCWTDIADDGTWTIPTEPGEKGNAKTLKLPKLALDIINAQPRIVVGRDREGNPVENPFVFAARVKGHVAGFGPLKAKLDAAIRKANDGKDIDPWTLHDLRRTAKSLMQWADVPSDISEAVLGHATPGIEATYGRHKFITKKAEALEKMAALVERILNPPADNVVPLTGRGQ